MGYLRCTPLEVQHCVDGSYGAPLHKQVTAAQALRKPNSVRAIPTRPLKIKVNALRRGIPLPSDRASLSNNSDGAISRSCSLGSKTCGSGMLDNAESNCPVALCSILFIPVNIWLAPDQIWDGVSAVPKVIRSALFVW